MRLNDKLKSISKMRKVIVSRRVRDKIVDLKNYLVLELLLSEDAATKRMDKIGGRLVALSSSGNYAKCRFRLWREAGYHCLSFEGWVFAYEIVPDGVIVRDMQHSKMLADVIY